jgi:hypothetical protein
VRLETIPLIVAILVALVGVGLIFDARLPDRAIGPSESRRERRRAPRIERHRGGETLVGIGILALAAALAGRDSWRYSIVAAFVGAIFVLWGAILNRRFLATLLSNRGKLRRRDLSAPTTPRTSGGAPKPGTAGIPTKPGTAKPTATPETPAPTPTPEATGATRSDVPRQGA